jgi:hypothetical protein
VLNTSGGGAEHNNPAERRAVNSRICNIWILMCRSSVESIIMMFDVLDCYILYIYIYIYMFVAICILYTCFRGSPAGEADKIGFFLKKIPR